MACPVDNCGQPVDTRLVAHGGSGSLGLRSTDERGTMSELAELHERVTRLERRMDDVHDLASGADREVAGWRGVLSQHTRTLNAMNEKIDLFQQRVDQRFEKVDQRFEKVDERFEQVDQRFEQVDQRFEKVDRRFDRLETEMRTGFARVDAEMRDGFARVDAEARKNYSMLAQGQQKITDLLTRHLGEEPGGGG